MNHDAAANIMYDFRMHSYAYYFYNIVVKKVNKQTPHGFSQ